MKTNLKLIYVLLTMCVTLPIGYYLLYQILTAINATELVWFLYWIYLPLTILVTFIAKLIEE